MPPVEQPLEYEDLDGSSNSRSTDSESRRQIRLRGQALAGHQFLCPNAVAEGASKLVRKSPPTTPQRYPVELSDV